MGTSVRMVEPHLERRDVLRSERVVTVARTFSRGVLKGYGKTSRSRRRVPALGAS